MWGTYREDGTTFYSAACPSESTELSYDRNFRNCDGEHTRAAPRSGTAKRGREPFPSESLSVAQFSRGCWEIRTRRTGGKGTPRLYMKFLSRSFDRRSEHFPVIHGHDESRDPFLKGGTRRGRFHKVAARDIDAGSNANGVSNICGGALEEASI